jgi:CubicO group peptidase (beta-lactamase class C family)
MSMHRCAGAAAAALALALPHANASAQDAAALNPAASGPLSRASAFSSQDFASPGDLRRRRALAAVLADDGPRGGLGQSVAAGCDLLVDDFEDGDHEGWTTYSSTLDDSQAFVEDGRLVLDRPAGGSANPWHWFGTAWSASLGDSTYHDGTIGVTFRIDEPGTTFLVFGRWYFVQFMLHEVDGEYALVINGAGEGLFGYSALARVPFTPEFGADYRMEARFVGPDLSLKVWKVGDEEPAEPQLTAVEREWTDPSLQQSLIGLEIDGFWSADARRVRVGDVTFCPEEGPEPPEIDPGSIPVSGIPVAGLAFLDDWTRDFMALTGTQSFVQSFMVNGKVQYHRAFGWADEAHSETLQPDAMFRLASVSKPFTAAAIRELVREQRLKMKDKVFNLGQKGGGILDLEPFPALGDERYKSITVQHLIEHTSGWDRGVYGDIAFCDFEAAHALGVPLPISREDRIRFLLSTPLQYNPGDPGVVDPYSNAAYEVLGLIVEKVSGMEFDEYVRQNVLPAMGIPPWETGVGASFPEDFNPREPFYDELSAGRDVFNEGGPWVRLPYGGWNNESYHTWAGRIAASAALLEFGSQRILFGPDAGRSTPRHLPKGFFDLHSGAFPGTHTVLVHLNSAGNDVVNVVLSNHRFYDGQLSIHPGAIFLFDHLLQGWNNWPQRRTGDMNCDGRVDAFDIEPFFEAITDIEAYAAAHTDCTGFNADTNGDLAVDYDDIAGFVECLSNGGCEK